MTIGLALILAGLSQTFAGFIFFRHPGVPWFFTGPVWKADKYLTPPGVALWVGGLAVGAVGILIHYLA